MFHKMNQPTKFGNSAHIDSWITTTTTTTFRSHMKTRDRPAHLRETYCSKLSVTVLLRLKHGCSCDEHRNRYEHRSFWINILWYNLTRV